MRTVLKVLDRGLVVLAAYLAASVFATLSLTIAFSFMDGPSFSVLFLGMFYGTSLVTMYAALPTAIVVAIAERGRFRSPRFYAVTGGLTGVLSIAFFFLTPLVERRSTLGDTFTPTQLAEFAAWLAACAVTGVLAGLIYWRVAGREAGAWYA